MQILRKADFVVISFFVLLAVGLIFAFAVAGNKTGAFAAVFLEGEEVLVIDIRRSEGQRFGVASANGINTVLVEGGAVRMLRADCPDQYCVGMGAISGTFQTITCLPNRVIVEIRGGVADDVDIIAQ